MTRLPRTRFVSAAAVLTAAVMVLAAVPGNADSPLAVSDRPAAPAFKAMGADTDTKVKEITVSWSGAGDRDYTEAARVPGIGTLKLVCKPKNTIVKLTADSRVPETQMWLAKHEWKNGNQVVAVKNARIYKYANANDDGTGGTGRSAHEGLNQVGHVENRSEGGYAYGLISQRPGRHRPAGTAPLRPVTSFYLTWFWNGFDHPRQYQSCEFKLRMVTHYAERLGINWHGDQDAAGNEVRTGLVPGLGEVGLTCRTGGRSEDQWVTLAPEATDPAVLEGSYADFFVMTGEGRVEDHVETVTGYEYDPETGLIGPIDLPRNGMMRVKYHVGDVTRWFYLSSYMVVNNARNPELNVCEVAMGGAADQL